MDPWTLGLIAVLVLGLAAIVYGALHDRARNRRATAEMLSPPDRHIPRFTPETPAPQYLSELQARRAPAHATSTELAAADRDRLSTELHDPATISVGTGYASKSFVTDPSSSWAVLDDPAVLVCAAPVTSTRELLPVMERAAMSARALVIVAPSFSADVLATLEVNVIQQKLRLLAVAAKDPEALNQLAAATGATPLQRSDLQAGYVPAEQLGHGRRWVSDQRRSWVLPISPSTSSGRESTSSGRESTSSGGSRQAQGAVDRLRAPAVVSGPRSRWAYLAAITPIIFGTTYLLTTEFLPPERPLLAALMRSLPTGIVLVLGTGIPPRHWWGRFALLSVLYCSAFFPLLFVAAYRLPGGVAAVINSLDADHRSDLVRALAAHQDQIHPSAGRGARRAGSRPARAAFQCAPGSLGLAGHDHLRDHDGLLHGADQALGLSPRHERGSVHRLDLLARRGDPAAVHVDLRGPAVAADRAAMSPDSPIWSCSAGSWRTACGSGGCSNCRPVR